MSEVLQTELGANTTVSLDGLQNVSKNVSPLLENRVQTELHPRDQQFSGKLDEKTKKTILQNNEMTFADALSLNSVTTDG